MPDQVASSILGIPLRHCPHISSRRAERRRRMTKADLIDEVSRLAELTRKDSEVIVETIFESVVRSCAPATRSRSAALAASAPGSASLAWGAIQRPAIVLKFRPRRFRSSSPARS